MAQNLTKIATFLCILLPFWTFSPVVSAASDAAPAPAADCSTLIISLADCLSFVSAGSNEKKPQGSCCSGLKTVMKTNPSCLCEAFKNSAQFGVSLNITKAMTMPSACHVSAPAISNCGVDVVTGAAPAPSPMAASPTAVAGGPTTSGGEGSETAPTGSPSSSSAISVFSLPLVRSIFAAIAFSVLRLF